MPDAEDLQVIACNMAEGTRSASEGALAYVLRTNPGGGHDHIVLLIRSRGGRWITKWEAMRRLTNFRLKAIPPAHPLFERLSAHVLPPGDELEALRAANRRERPVDEGTEG